MRVAVGVLLVEADDLEQLVHAVETLFLAGDEVVDVQALGDDVPTTMRGFRRPGVLEDHLHLAIQEPGLVALRPVDVLPVEEHFAEGS